MSELDDREHDDKELAQKELTERELADKLASFATAVTKGEPDSTILAMLNDFEASDAPSEDTLRVCLIPSSATFLSEHKLPQKPARGNS